MKMKTTEAVTSQYQDEKNLEIRRNLHLKHSTNKQGFHPWLFEQQYEFKEGYRILELGCGSGGQWEGQMESLPKDCTLILTDFSDGMVDVTWEKYKKYEHVFAMRMDIQSIPFPHEVFDVIIANHMLYHVPDLEKALSEVYRVLKPEGKFYAATNGSIQEGMPRYLKEVLHEINPEIKCFHDEFPFNLQNGTEILSRHFGDVVRADYKDSLDVTETKDLVDWLKSTITMSEFSEQDLKGAFEYFENIREKEGAIHIPKSSGTFICTKK